jgi:hypothetical protein
MPINLMVNAYTSRVASVAELRQGLRHSLRNNFGKSGLAWTRAGQPRCSHEHKRWAGRTETWRTERRPHTPGAVSDRATQPPTPVG